METTGAFDGKKIILIGVFWLMAIDLHDKVVSLVAKTLLCTGLAIQEQD